MADAPPNAQGHATGNGWTKAEIFMKWLEHFAEVARAAKDNKQIIILDGHHSHKTLTAVLYARERGITLITLPPHSTHRMQPLDRAQGSCFPLARGYPNGRRANQSHILAGPVGQV